MVKATVEVEFTEEQIAKFGRWLERIGWALLVYLSKHL
jgi:hypothetical protein